MTFVTASALLIALFVALPAIAHMLKWGGAAPLPFALSRLVKPEDQLSSRRGQFHDRLLFTLRALLILALALLGAVPLVRCDHPMLTRQNGASVALAIVLDDSGSMRANLKSGQQRFALAKQSALHLISQLHDGDVVILILAGRPARLVIGATPQLQLALELCRQVPESDRSTDLAGALDLATSSLHNLPQSDHRLAVLSDLSQPLDKTVPDLWLPSPELSQPIEDCGIVTANRQAGQVEVRVACTNIPATTVRKLVLQEAPTTKLKRAADLPAALQVDISKSVQTLTFNNVQAEGALEVRLDGSDDNRFNDAADVFTGTTGFVVATLTDYATGRAATGGPPLIEQALASFGDDLLLRPWTTMPEESGSYSDVSMLVLDDPGPLGPEVRAPLKNWVERGGVAAAFFGQRAVGDQLGVSLVPFLDGAAIWEAGDFAGLSLESINWLGATAKSWQDIHARGRLNFEQAIPSVSLVRGRWLDNRVAILERAIGRGMLVSAGFPVSANLSDAALRPAFLALLESLVVAARERGRAPVIEVGQPWKLDKDEDVHVTGPGGAVLAPSVAPEPANREKSYVPSRSGIYEFRHGDAVEYRMAHLSATEITDTPNSLLSTHAPRGSTTRSRVDISPHLAAAIALIVLLHLTVQSWPSRLTRRGRSGGALPREAQK